MEDWQRRAFERVREVWDEDATGGDIEASLEVAAALGGLPVVRLEGGFPVILEEPRSVAVDGPRCGVVITRGVLKGRGCPRVAGQGTVHKGIGRCVAHGGAKRQGRAEAAWMAGHAFARELECSPWEGLLRAVRVAAGKLAYCEWVLSQASSDLELEGRFGRDEGGVLVHPDTGEPLGGGQVRNLAWWVGKSELWTDRLARYSKMACDAGVAERLVAQVELEGQSIGRVLSVALEEVSELLDEAAVARVRARMRSELLMIEQETASTRVRASGDADGRVVDSTYVDEEKR